MSGLRERVGGGRSWGRGRGRAWVELLRLPALFTVPGDALAGVATAGARPDRRTLAAVAASLCLYEAGMALNDWADRAEDAIERPHRPLPSGRVRPGAALVAAGALTAAGLGLAACAGRRAVTVAAPLAATVWAYDLGLKHTAAGPVGMGAARGLDLILGAAASSGGSVRAAVPSALALAAHTTSVTVVSRHEARGGSRAAPLAALAATGLLTWRLSPPPPLPVPNPGAPPPDPHIGATRLFRAVPRAPSQAALAAAYAATPARPLLHAALNPSPPLTQRAVSAGIGALIPLQAALAARAGAPLTGAVIAALGPAARRFGRKVSVT